MIANSFSLRYLQRVYWNTSAGAKIRVDFETASKDLNEPVNVTQLSFLPNDPVPSYLIVRNVCGDYPSSMIMVVLNSGA